ncbi:hypothetical protein ACFSQD_06740 [Flavihumibacter stibioxidans]|uniref:Uncharacterized protein n=1 Tax=Flavihumibacter stibioxidans TaxID=1834163 RepID=A0ABR7M4S9_9BACT|nr:hypothetical protein [Flavihumibacter stibioxidans]MBC6490008.1 hypothetical protein [Flavihumibacter stibioxidans]
MKQVIFKHFSLAVVLILLSASSLCPVRAEKCFIIKSCSSTVEIRNLQMNASQEQEDDSEDNLPIIGGVTGMSMIFL